MAVSEITSEAPQRRAGQWPAHPLLLAACPVILLFASSVGEASLGDLWLPLAASICGAALLLLVLRLITRSWQRGALIASLAVGMFFTFQHAYRGIYIATGLAGLPLLSFPAYLVIWLLVLAIGAAVLLRRPRTTGRATQVLNIFALLLLAIALGGMIRPFYRQWKAQRADRDEGPLALQVQQDSPDIYYLIFDRYASLDTLQRHFGYDNRPFYEQLRRRGFYCAEKSHANYPRTKISMASALNMRLLADPVYADHIALLRSHRVGRALRAAGYDYYHVGSWYGPLRHNRDAIYNWPASPYPSYFAQELCRMTPLLPIIQLARGERLSHVPRVQTPAAVEAKFAKIEEIAGRQGRKFVYAHFLLPHPPFIFNADGTPTTPEQVSSRTYQQSYVQQLIYANQRILKLLDAIAARSSRPPVIVIQADEGPILVASDQRNNPLEQIGKRTGIISAFRLPGRDAAALVPADVTPVNTFRIVFNSYFGTKLPLLPNRVFYWDHPDRAGIPDSSKYVRVVDVTDLLAKPAPPQRTITE